MRATTAHPSPDPSAPPPGGLLWRAWLGLGRALGHVTSVVLLTFIYYVVLGPFALAAGRWRAGWVPSERGALERPF